MSNLLEIKDLKTYFMAEDEVIPAVDGVSFSIKHGETLCVVGESGSGKSMTSLSILQLVPEPYGKIVHGEIMFKGKNLLDLSEAEIRKIRGNDISMIFQEPMTSLNPVFTIGDQITESIILHEKLDKKAAKEKAITFLKLVGIPDAEKRFNEYPHQLSGGMRQRVMIAMALACGPELLIADEPTTALDVTTQAQILDLMNDVKEKMKMSILLITHDLGVVAETADHVAVMYLGRIVEYADADSFFEDPKHPYSKGLLQSIPDMEKKVNRLSPIKGQVPKPTDVKVGCRFASRCEFARDLCHKEEPAFIETDHHQVKCWMFSDRWDCGKESEMKQDEG